MPLLKITADQLEIPVHDGDLLQEICDNHPTGILFGCFSARCGACLIRVTENPEGLSPIEDMEAELLETIATGPDQRLACQCSIRGELDVTIEVVPPK